MKDQLDQALAQLDYALILADPGPPIMQVRRILLNLRVDVDIAESGLKALAEQANAATEELPPLVTDTTKERHFVPDKYEKLEGRSLTQSKAIKSNQQPAKSVKCPTCGAPPWHYCAKVSKRGPGNVPLGASVKDHRERRNKAHDKHTKAVTE